jgi:hypothetical protein
VRSVFDADSNIGLVDSDGIANCVSEHSDDMASALQALDDAVFLPGGGIRYAVGYLEKVKNL